MRVFIFGIGGTGSRVLRSLAMLLASGVKFNHQDLTIIPIVIDTDAHNGDTTRTRDLLRNYYSIRKTFVNKIMTAQSDIFFNTQIRSFNSLDTDGSDGTDLDVQFNFQNQDITFEKFIGYPSLKTDENKNDKDILNLFYSNIQDKPKNQRQKGDDSPELYLNLSLGFKGNPNIGCVVFNDLINSPQFIDLASSFSENDRVFIISSIFGGTGSSGFPTLVKIIRSSENTSLRKAKIGAITLMPYFNVKPDEKSAINSAIFDTKTKAALSFYAEDSHLKSINAQYYIADNKVSGDGIPNREGGEEQINDGHVIEMISATAIVDFINKQDGELEIPHCLEFGIEKPEIPNPLAISHFFEETKAQYFIPLIKFAYAAKIATDFIPHLTKDMFFGSKELNISGSLGVPNEYRKLIAFFEEFKKWSAKEMSNQNNGRAFASFNFEEEDNMNSLVYGKEIKTGFFNNGLTKKEVSEYINKIEVKEPKDMPTPHKYLTTLYKTAGECLKVLGQLP